MTVKLIEDNIKKVFTDLGFTEEEVKEGCWLLERNKQPVAWIALHKFLERVALKAGIVFDDPFVMCSEKDEYESTKWVDNKKVKCLKETRNIAIQVKGDMGDKTSWAIGEVSGRNCLNDYPWAMAEKRAKDRVILKLLGVAGDMYSEEEADDFKKENKAPDEPKNKYDNPKDSDAINSIKAELDRCKDIGEFEIVKDRLEGTTYPYFDKKNQVNNRKAVEELVEETANRLGGK